MKNGSTTEKTMVYVLLGMTVVTGLVDAVSFLSLGRVFTANMTGNVVILAFATARVSGLSIARSSTALLSFFVGAILGGRIMARASAEAQIQFAAQAFLVEIALLLAASFCAIGYNRGHLPEDSFQAFALIALMALAMGHTQCRCPETRNPRFDDNGPDANGHGYRRGFFHRERH